MSLELSVMEVIGGCFNYFSMYGLEIWTGEIVGFHSALSCLRLC